MIKLHPVDYHGRRKDNSRDPNCIKSLCRLTITRDEDVLNGPFRECVEAGVHNKRIKDPSAFR